MKNKVIGAIAIASTIMLCSCGIKVYSDKDYIKREIKITAPFNAIESYDTSDVIYTNGDQPSVVVFAPEELMNRIQVRIENGKLIISQESSHNNFGNLARAKIEVSYQGVNRFSTYGTGDFKISELKVDTLRLETAGTGDIDGKKINASVMIAETLGTGDIELDKVAAKNIFLSSNGTGDIEIESVDADNITAKTVGTGDIVLKGKCNTLESYADGTGKIKKKELNMN